MATSPRPLEASIPGGTAITAGRIALAAAAALAVGPGPAAAAHRTWTPKFVTQYLPRTNHSAFDAVVVEGARAWFFGGSDVSGRGRGRPEAEDHRAGHWTSAALPSGLRSWIVAASASSRRNIWAVTYLGGAVLRFDGSAWRTQPKGGWLAGNQFTGVVALAPANVWLFGAAGPRHPGAGTWHWSGTRWTRARGAADGLAQASAASATDIWAIGGAVLARFDGTAWHRVHPAALAGFSFSHVLALARGNVWVAGSVAGTPELGHFDGSGWQALTMPGSTPARSICRDGSGGLWVIANSGPGPHPVLHRSAAGHWSSATVGSSAADRVLDCAWVPGTRAAWGAGRAAPPPGASGTAAAAYGTGPVP